MIRWKSWEKEQSKQHVSFFAIVETIAACIISLMLAIKYEIWLHIVVSAIVAPVLLLRTPVSTKLALRWFLREGYRARKWYEDRQSKVIPLTVVYWMTAPLAVWFLWRNWSVLTTVLVILGWLIAGYYFRIFAILALVVRIRSTLTTVCRRPLYSMACIPNNWARVCFMTDMTCPPELIPEIERYGPGKSFRASEFFESFLLPSKQSRLITALDYIGMIFSSALMRLASYLYRWSLKASSLLYLPLLWIVRSDRVRSEIVEERLDEICTVSWEKFKRVYALVVIVASVGFGTYILTIGRIRMGWPSHWLLQFWVPIESLGAWHISRFFAAIVTWYLLIYAQRKRLSIGHQISSRREKILGRLLTIEIVRQMLSLFTIVCGVYLVVVNVDWSVLPAIKWLP